MKTYGSDRVIRRMNQFDIYSIFLYGFALIVVLYLIQKLVARPVILDKRPSAITEAAWWPWPITKYSWWPYWTEWCSGGKDGGYPVGGGEGDSRNTIRDPKRPWGGEGREANAIEQ
jgi:hypothetical protein